MHEGTSTKHVLALFDILGASSMLCSDDVLEFKNGLVGIYDEIADSVGPYSYKTFSDTVLIFSDDTDGTSVDSLISTVASIQFNIMCNMGLMIRGGVVVDDLFREMRNYGDELVIGRAMVRAHELESKKAIYPRVLVGSEIRDRLSDGSLVVRESDRAFINYLQVTMDEEGFLDRESLARHASALRRHILHDNSMTVDGKRPRGREWDSIRSKDEWVLAYHNNLG